MGIVGSGRVPLELLIVARPDIVASSFRDYGAPALAQENFVHPAFAALEAASQTVATPTPNMICGAPFTLDAAFVLLRAGQEGAR
jgi:iron complex transport system substrate-binding protein